MVAQVKYIGYTGTYLELAGNNQEVTGNNTFSSATSFNNLTVTGTAFVPNPTLTGHALNLGTADGKYALKSPTLSELSTLPANWSVAKFKTGNPVTYLPISDFGASLINSVSASGAAGMLNAAILDVANVFTQTNTFPSLKITEAISADGRIGKNLTAGDGLTITGIKPDTNTTRRVTIDGDLIVKGNVKSSDAGIPADIWTAGNDGPGTGMNADLLDGYHAQYFIDMINNKDLSSYYRKTDASVTTSGNLTIQNFLKVSGAAPKLNLVNSDNTKYSTSFDLSNTDLTIKRHINDVEQKYGTFSLMNLNLATGNVTFGGDVVAFSDMRLKKNIRSLDTTTALAAINMLRVTEFDWKESDKHEVGLIAQDLENILPSLVDSTGEYKTVAYTKIIPYLIAAIQDLYGRLPV